MPDGFDRATKIEKDISDRRLTGDYDGFIQHDEEATLYLYQQGRESVAVIREIIQSSLNQLILRAISPKVLIYKELYY